MKTKSEGLQKALGDWVQLVTAAFALSNPSLERTDAIIDFCRTFVPPDVTEDDIMHFSGNLSSDEVSFDMVWVLNQLIKSGILNSFFLIDLDNVQEFFESLCRELKQCESGERVEKIEGDQKRKAIFTLLPPEGTCKRGDIERGSKSV